MGTEGLCIECCITRNIVGDLSMAKDEDKISVEMREKIIERLSERDALKKCPRCNNKKFVLGDKYFMMPTQVGFDDIVIGDTIPCAIVICNKCGYISLHALGGLALLNEAKDEGKDE